MLRLLQHPKWMVILASLLASAVLCKHGIQQVSFAPGICLAVHASLFCLEHCWSYLWPAHVVQACQLAGCPYTRLKVPSWAF